MNSNASPAVSPSAHRALLRDFIVLADRYDQLLADRNALARECADLRDDLASGAVIVARAGAILAMDEWAREVDGEADDCEEF